MTITAIVGIIEGHPPSGSAPSVSCAYPLDDDGTIAALFGRGPAPALEPDYQHVNYTYLAPATGNAAIAISSDPWGVAAKPITGKMAVEAIINSAPATFNNIGISAVASTGGVPNLANIVNMTVSRASTDLDVNGEQGLTLTTGDAAEGFRIGMEFNGNDGTVTFVCSAGSLGTTPLPEFAPGESLTIAINITDNTGATAGETVEMTLVTEAAYMTLAYSSGATDLCGNAI